MKHWKKIGIGLLLLSLFLLPAAVVGANSFQQQGGCGNKQDSCDTTGSSVVSQPTNQGYGNAGNSERIPTINDSAPSSWLNNKGQLITSPSSANTDIGSDDVPYQGNYFGESDSGSDGPIQNIADAMQGAGGLDFTSNGEVISLGNASQGAP
jgi:hypothetical protein